MGLLVSAKGAPTPHFASCYSATRGNRTMSRPVPHFVMHSELYDRRNDQITLDQVERIVL